LQQTKPVTIRSASISDVEFIYKFICLLESVELDYKRFEQIFQEQLAQTNIIYLVALIDNIGIGFISCQGQLLLHHNGWVFEIQELYIEESARKKGIGRLLIHEVEKEVKLKKSVSLEVTAQNKRIDTHQFYLRQGFKQTHLKFTKPLAL